MLALLIMHAKSTIRNLQLSSPDVVLMYQFTEYRKRLEWIKTNADQPEPFLARPISSLPSTILIPDPLLPALAPPNIWVPTNNRNPLLSALLYSFIFRFCSLQPFWAAGSEEKEEIWNKKERAEEDAGMAHWKVGNVDWGVGSGPLQTD